VVRETCAGAAGAAFALLVTGCALGVRPPEDAAAATIQAETEVARAELLADLRKRLDASDGLTLAWAAQAAIQANARELVPELAAALRRACAIPERYTPPYVQSPLVDALIQFDARLEPADLVALVDLRDCYEESLIFAARAPARHVGLLEWMQEHSGSLRFIAASNLLAQAAPARAAVCALRDVQITITIQVVDVGTPEENRAFTTRRIVCGLGPHKKPLRGFPPLVRHELRDCWSRAEPSLVEGPDPVQFVRLVEATNDEQESRLERLVERSEYSMRLLHWLAGEREEYWIPTGEERITNAWIDAEVCAREVGARIQVVREQWRSLLARLVEQQLLDRACLSAADPITIQVVDGRADHSVPLPDFAAIRM
jgi:hypothetical protein